MTSGDKIRVVIVDDHPLFRHGLKQVVEADERFELLGEADCGRTALHLIATKTPQLAVLDLGLPDISGLQLAATLRKQNSATQIVVLTMLKDEQAFNHAIDLGIQGYVLKENAVTEIINCMLAVAAGRAYVSPSISGYLLRRRSRAAALAAREPGLEDLTVAERRVLKRIAEKKTSKVIAAELAVSPRTVETHRAKICSKLGLKGSNSLLQFALENREALNSLS
ncbi:MAG: response regulator transcription factor [Steroidobacteraceae bacterium]